MKMNVSINDKSYRTKQSVDSDRNIFNYFTISQSEFEFNDTVDKKKSIMNGRSVKLRIWSHKYMDLNTLFKSGKSLILLNEIPAGIDSDDNVVWAKII